MAGPFRTPQKYTFHTELRGARGVITNLNAISRALNVTRLAATKTFQLDKQIRTLSVQMKEGANNATELAQASLGLASATSANVDNTTKLITAYQRTGQSMGKFTSGASKTTSVFASMTKSQHRSIRAQTQLVDLYGLSVSEVVQLNSRMSNLGISFDDMLGTAATFQRKFKIPGVMKELAKVTNFAESATKRFSKSVTGGTQGVIAATLRTGAVYSKTYGVDISQAIGMAQKQQEHFMKQSQKDSDVFLGLEQQFDGLTMAMFEAGLQIEGITALTAKGQKDPIAYAESIRDIYNSLGGDATIQGKRFMRQFQQMGDAMSVGFLMHPESLKRAREQKDLIADFNKGMTIDKKGLESFDELSTSLRKIGGVALEMIGNLTGLFKTIVGTAFAKTLSKAFQGAIPVIKRFNIAISEMVDSFIKSDFWEYVEDYVEPIGKVLVGVGAAAGVLATAFASTIIPAKLLISAIRIIPLIGNPAAGGMKALTGSMFAFAKGSFDAVAAVTGIGVALNDFGDYLKRPADLRDGAVTTVRTFRAMALGIVETFDGLLGGIPTWIAKKFFPTMRGTIGDNVKTMFQEFQGWIEDGISGTTGHWWVKFKNSISGYLYQFRLDLLSNWAELETNAIDWGGNIGRALGTIGKWAWDAISPLFEMDTWKGYWTKITDYFNGDGKSGLGDSFDGIYKSITTLTKSFGKSLIDELLRPWGSGWIEASNKLLDFWDDLRIKFSWASNVGLPKLEDKFLSFKIGLVDAFYAIKDGAKHAFGFIKGGAKELVGTVGETINSIGIGVKQATLWRAEAALTRAMANPFSTEAERQARVVDVMRVQGEIKTLETSQAYYATMAKSGAGERETAESNYEIDRKASKTAAADMNKEAIARQKELRGEKGEIAGGERNYDTAVEKIEKERKARNEGPDGVRRRLTVAESRQMGLDPRARNYMRSDKLITRDRDRKSQDARRASDMAKADGLKKPYIDKAAKLLSALEARAGAKAPGAPGLTELKTAIAKIKEHKGDLRDIKTPQEGRALWDKITGTLRKTADAETNKFFADKAGFDPTTGDFDIKEKSAPTPQSTASPAADAGATTSWNPEAQNAAAAEGRRTEHLVAEVRIAPGTDEGMASYMLNHTLWQWRGIM